MARGAVLPGLQHQPLVPCDQTRPSGAHGALGAAGTSAAAVGFDKLGGYGVLYRGLESVGGTPDQLDALLREDFEKYARLVKQLNIRID